MMNVHELFAARQESPKAFGPLDEQLPQTIRLVLGTAMVELGKRDKWRQLSEDEDEQNYIETKILCLLGSVLCALTETYGVEFLCWYKEAVESGPMSQHGYTDEEREEAITTMGKVVAVSALSPEWPKRKELAASFTRYVTTGIRDRDMVQH